MRGAAFSLRLLGALVAGTAAGAPALADEPPPAWLVFGGLSAGADYAATYAGAIAAPSRDLWAPGLRLRPAFTAGFYRAGGKGARRTVPFASSAFMAGYQLAAGDVSLALYGGAEAVHFARADPPHYSAGWHLGAKVLAEASLPVGDRGTLGGHVGYGTALGRLEVGGKLLSRLAGPWQLGPAAAYFDKPDGSDLRLGLALARRGERSGLSASAGLSLDQDKGASPYLTIGFDQSF